jgi:putative ABC transport system substrate-binding protein
MKRRSLLAAMAASWALAGRAAAQPAPKVWRLGMLMPDTVQALRRDIDILKAALRDLGYVEGRNIAFEYRYTDAIAERLPVMARELVDRQVDVIVTYTSGASAARHFTDRIPIVQVAGPDPVAVGIAKSIAKPGGNVTGLTIFVAEIMAKRLELLREVDPAARRVGVLLYRSHPANPPIYDRMGQTAAALGVELLPIEVGGPTEFPAAFVTWQDRKVQAVISHDHSVFSLGANAQQLAALAIGQRIPLLGAVDQCRNGGLMSYGVNIQALFMRSATYVDRILRGASPGDMPIEQPSEFVYAVNLRTAKAIGITIPPSVLVRADELIE